MELNFKYEVVWLKYIYARIINRWKGVNWTEPRSNTCLCIKTFCVSERRMYRISDRYELILRWINAESVHAEKTRFSYDSKNKNFCITFYNRGKKCNLYEFNWLELKIEFPQNRRIRSIKLPVLVGCVLLQQFNRKRFTTVNWTVLIVCEFYQHKPIR